MARLVILGTAYVIPDVMHENAHMVLDGTDGLVLIDCGTSPIVTLSRAGMDPMRLQSLIVTHFHPDHLSGVAMLLLNLWLMGRRDPLAIHGLQKTLSKTQALMELFEWRNWPEFYPVAFKPISPTEGVLVMETTDFTIVASPAHHLVPSIALKITSETTGRSLMYTSDTSPCDSLVRLARGADILLHEASGASSGHSSAAMAGTIARMTGVSHLVFIHYPVQSNPDDLIAEAHSTFDGKVTVAQDRDEFEL